MVIVKANNSVARQIRPALNHTLISPNLAQDRLVIVIVIPPNGYSDRVQTRSESALLEGVFVTFFGEFSE